MKKVLFEYDLSRNKYSSAGKGEGGLRLFFLKMALDDVDFEELLHVLASKSNYVQTMEVEVFWYEDNINIVWYLLADEELANDPEEPELILSPQNFREILQTWKTMLMDKPPYLVITQDDDGWVKIQGKHELSVEDQQSIEEDNLKG